MLSLIVAHGVSAEPCALNQVGELPVTMVGMRPTVHAKVNGTDAIFLADSGAFFNTLSQAGAERLHLPLGHAPVSVMFISGRADTHLTKVSLTLFGIEYHKVEFLVAGSEIGGEIVGLLGQNVFRIGETEYDLANGMIRVLRTTGDCNKKNLAYWANAKNQVASDIDIEFATAAQPHNNGTVYVNGQRMHVTFDTGASTTLLDSRAARRAGLTPPSPGAAGRPPTSWIASVDSFKIGDEEVKHTRLRVGSMGAISNTDMLIGADFFLAHHVLVATSQRKLYFTYNGGPVFNLTDAPAAAPAAGTAASPESGAGAEGGTTAEQAAPTAAPSVASGTSLDASGYARRGAAETSRHDYEHAIADLTRACELAPNEPDYFYQRGMAYWYAHQADTAFADFDQAIKLRPDHVDALLARASLRLGRHDPAEPVISDLDATSRAVPKESDVRMRLGSLYREVGALDAAIAEDTKWIDSHKREDTNMPQALRQRCFARALAAKDLDKALEDCDAALRMRHNEPIVLQDRGLVQLRLGHYDRAIGDFDAALHLAPKYSWALYGRGIAKARTGDSAGSQADIAAATALAPKLPDEAARYGITP